LTTYTTTTNNLNIHYARDICVCNTSIIYLKLYSTDNTLTLAKDFRGTHMSNIQRLAIVFISSILKKEYYYTNVPS